MGEARRRNTNSGTNSSETPLTPSVKLRGRQILLTQELDTQIREVHQAALKQAPLLTATSENDFICAAILNGLQVMRQGLAEIQAERSRILPPTAVLPKDVQETMKKLAGKRVIR